MMLTRRRQILLVVLVIGLLQAGWGYRALAQYARFMRVTNSESGQWDILLNTAGQVLTSNGEYAAPTFEDLGGTDASFFRLIGGGRSVILTDTPLGGSLYGEDITENYSLGAINAVDGSGLLQRFLYGMFQHVYARTYTLTNATATDFVQPVTLDTDSLVHLGGGRAVVADNSVTVPTLVITSTAFASLPSALNGTILYCADCEAITSPCVGSGTGAFAKRINGVWRCD